MDEKELIRLLQEKRPQAPSAPHGEWKAVARRTQPWSWGGWLRAPWALSGGLALAGLALMLLRTPESPAVLDDATLEPYLSELRQTLLEAQGRPAFGEDYLALLDEAE